jgi:hypothetical protein
MRNERWLPATGLRERSYMESKWRPSFIIYTGPPSIGRHMNEDEERLPVSPSKTNDARVVMISLRDRSFLDPKTKIYSKYSTSLENGGSSK